MGPTVKLYTKLPLGPLSFLGLVDKTAVLRVILTLDLKKALPLSVETPPVTAKL